MNDEIEPVKPFETAEDYCGFIAAMQRNIERTYAIPREMLEPLLDVQERHFVEHANAQRQAKTVLLMGRERPKKVY